MPTQLTIGEADQVERLRIVGCEGDRLRQDLECAIVQSGVVERLGQVHPHHAREWIEPGGLLERGRCGFLPAPRLFGETQLHQRRRLPWREAMQRAELFDRGVELSQGREGASQLESRVGILGLPPQPLTQFRHATVVETGLFLHQLQVFLGDRHPGVELERAGKRRDRLGKEATLVIEDAEVVVRAGIGRVDATGEGSQDGEIALRRRGGHA